jgi:hypothetical protein
MNTIQRQFFKTLPMPRGPQRASFYTFNTPKDTPRVVLSDGSVLIQRQKTQAPTEWMPLPPPLRKTSPFRQLSDAEKKELISLRTSNPDLWTVHKLALKFNIPNLQVISLVKCPLERKERLEKEMEQEFKELSVGKKRTIIERIRRKALW